MTIEHDDCIKKGKIKPFSRGVTLAPKELETAKADLETARKTYKEGNRINKDKAEDPIRD